MIHLKFSVVVCTYNQSERLMRMLKSLRETVIPDNVSCEFILVDNNLDDDKKRFVFEEVERHCDSKIRYVFEEKRGISHARNRGIKEAKGEIIAFTDDDAIVDKYWIQNIEKAFKEHGDVACIGGKLLPIWEISKPKWLKPDLFDYLALLDHGDSIAYMDSPRIWGANFAVKSEMFKKYGLFDSNLGRIPSKLYGYEETDFVLRLMNADEKILYYPLSIIYHCVPAHKMSKGYFRKWRFDQGEQRGIFLKDPKYYNLLKINSLTSIKMLRDISASVVKIGCFTKDRFNHELRICFILGFLLGRMKQMGMKS